MTFRALSILFVAGICAATSLATPGLHLAPLFTENMVLQRSARVPIWGTGDSGAVIRVKGSWGAQAETAVGSSGSWKTELATPSAGGPFELTVSHGDSTCILRNVLVGEVWLCSGQSNMEMPLAGWPPGDTVRNSAEEIRTSDLPGIRLFTVARAAAVLPATSCVGSWVESSPRTTPAFSATAYFFGRELHRRLGVPIGLIHASWGGTPVESWMSVDTLERIAGYDSLRHVMAEMAAGKVELDAWRSKYRTMSVLERPAGGKWKGLAFDDSICSEIAFQDSAWLEMRLPIAWERSSLGDFDGAVWFRKRVEIPPAWVHRPLVLELGPVDDVDITYVNGRLVGAHEEEGMWKVDRVYQIPPGVVSDTVLTIAVRVIDFQGGGGIFGDAASLRVRPDSGDGEVSLAGTWRYLPVAEYAAQSFVVFGATGEEFKTRPPVGLQFSAYSPTTLFNGMIHPLVPYAVRGAIWYQGEANTSRPETYQRLLAGLIRNWRDAFRSPSMPFFYVQIAPYSYSPGTHSELLREAQLRGLGVKNTGMAVTLDIGNANNIHPANKQDVGDRLARWALAKTYGKNVQYSGPLFKSMKKRKNTLLLSFDHAGKHLVLRPDSSGSGFQIAGPDSVFRDALAEVRGRSLAVWHPDVADPQAVRYAFSDTPPATLFNDAGLPAPSFRSDTWAP